MDPWIADALTDMECRGPDARGTSKNQIGNRTLCMGHNRLSIFDLSNAGIQPMESKSGRFTIVFNGEIYNYRELRQILSDDGLVFESGTDTEVLLEMWERFGESCLQFLEGMFSFAVFDKVQETLFLVRDQFGIKPMFYTSSRDLFAFSSTPEPLWKLVPSFVVREDTLLSFLSRERYDLASETFVLGVNSVEPGELVEISLGKQREILRKKWYVPRPKETNLSEQEAIIAIKEQLWRSVALHMRSDAPIAFALSGGIDSSGLVCIARDLYPDKELDVFVYAPTGFRQSEEHWATLVAEHVGARIHYVRPTLEEIRSAIPRLIRHQGEPIDNPRFIAQYFVFEAAAKQGFKVVIEGQGADEVFAGYLGYPNVVFLDKYKHQGFMDAIRFFFLASKVPGQSRINLASSICFHAVKPFMSSRFVDRIFLLAAGATRGGVLRLLRPTGVKTERRDGGIVEPAWLGHIQGNLRRELCRDTFFSLLPKLLRHGDRNAMAHSVENRVPYLYQPLVEMALSLPSHYLVSEEGQSKTVLRKVLEGTVPEEVLSRKDKVGFQTPEKAFESLLQIGIPKVPRFWKPVLRLRAMLLLHWLKYAREAAR